MTGADELRKRREQEALKIRTALNRQRGEQRASTKGGEGTVAFVEERKCIGCDQCTIVLNNVGSFRDSTLIGHYTDKPWQFDKTRYGGFYTKKEIKEVVRYAEERGINVIPEIEMPGHSQAAVSSYPEFGCTGEQVGVAPLWGVFKEIYCSKNETFDFRKFWIFWKFREKIGSLSFTTINNFTY